jgi:hypothetical protein
MVNNSLNLLLLKSYWGTGNVYHSMCINHSSVFINVQNPNGNKPS